MRYRPITPELLVERLADRLAAERPASRLRVAVDGAPAADPDALADALVDPLRARGRPVYRVRTVDFLRPASVRLEHGRHNPDAYYTGWLDENGLRREVLDPSGPAGTGRILPTLWDAEADRATRAEYLTLPATAVVVVSGPLLLGGGLPVDFAIHLLVSAGALARRTPAGERWTLPAFERYAVEVDPPAFADVVVRMDDPTRPAVSPGLGEGSG